MYMKHQTVCKKREIIRNPNTDGENMSQDIGMEFGIEKRVMVIMKSEKQHMTERIKLLSQEKIRTFGETET